MSLLRYGPITLNFVTMRRFAREAKYNGPNYLYTEYTLEVEAEFNPAVQNDFITGAGSPVLGGNPPTLGVPLVPAYPIGANPVTGAPAPPTFVKPAPIGPLVPTPAVGPKPAIPLAPPFAGATTAAAVQDTLLRPRQQLQYSVGGVPVVTSPLPGYPLDSYNGPFPLYAHVTEMSGARTFRVLFGLKTAVNEQSLYRSQPPLILSHTFKVEHQLGSQWFADIVTSGRVVFDSAVVARAQAAGPGLAQQMDDLRRLFVPVLKAGCKRESIKVRAEEDGVTINYEVVDRELPIKWTQRGVTHVEGVHSILVKRADNEQLLIKNALGGLKNLLGGTLDIKPENFSPDPTNVRNIFGKLKLDLSKLIAGAITNVVEAPGVVYDTQPVNEHHVRVAVQGDMGSNRDALVAFGLAIIGARLTALSTLVRAFIGYEQRIEHVLEDKKVICEAVFRTGPIATLLSGVRLIGATFDLNPTPGNDSSGTQLIDDSANVTNIPGPGGDGSGRGFFLEDAVASALETQAIPNAPTVALPRYNAAATLFFN
jgi:hypothetical protein